MRARFPVRMAGTAAIVVVRSSLACRDYETPSSARRFVTVAILEVGSDDRCVVIAKRDGGLMSGKLSALARRVAIDVDHAVVSSQSAKENRGAAGEHLAARWR